MIGQTVSHYRILEKIGLYEQAVSLMDGLFRLYLSLRLSAAWEAELAKVQGWIRTKES